MVLLREALRRTSCFAPKTQHEWAWISINNERLPLETSDVNHPVHNWPIAKLDAQHRSIEQPVVTSIGARSHLIGYALRQHLLAEATVTAVKNTDALVAMWGFYEYTDNIGNYWCEPISADYTSGHGVFLMGGFELSNVPVPDVFPNTLCAGHQHHSDLSTPVEN